MDNGKIIRKGDVIVFKNVNFEKLRNRRKVEMISKHTRETWQPGRGNEERQRDTEQGKIAERCVECYLNNILKITYQSYDSFRGDKFIKHAPFDGLLFKEYNKYLLKWAIELVNKEVEKSSTGSASPELRDKLIKKGVYTVEIKSTKVTERLKRNNNIEAIIEAIKNNDDYLTYPHYCRSSTSIKDVNDYIKYSKQYDKTLTLANLKEKELPWMEYFYIRVYIDYEERVVYLIGFITKDMFFINIPQVKKMFKLGKSERAIYFAKNIRKVNVAIDKIKEYMR